jgi:hypothetical protein
VTTTDLPLVGAVDDVKPEEGDERFWSVTTIIGVLDKPALVQWSAIETAKAAVDNLDIVQSRIQREGRDSAIEYLKGARFRRAGGQRTAADLGTAVHEACESYALTGIRPQVDDEVRPFLRQFDRFLDQFQPSYIATEVTVYSPTYGYAGTLDAVVEVDGIKAVIDYKTSRESYDWKGNPKGPYPEVALQLAAYRYADLAAVFRARRYEQSRRRYYLLSQAEKDQAVPVPEVDGGLVVYLTPERFGVYPIRCDESVHESFLYCIEAARWSFETAKSVIGNPMLPPYPDPVDANPFHGLPTE